MQSGLCIGQTDQVDCLDSQNRLTLFNRNIRDTVSISLAQETEYLTDSIYMKVNLEPFIKYDYLIKGVQIELINTKSNSISFFDGVLNLVCQAKIEGNNWVDIEFWAQPWDYDGVPRITLRSNSSLKAVSPCYRGTLKAALRFRLEVNNATYYSNEFAGRINPGQLSN